MVVNFQTKTVCTSKQTTQKASEKVQSLEAYTKRKNSEKASKNILYRVSQQAW